MSSAGKGSGRRDNFKAFNNAAYWDKQPGATPPACPERADGGKHTASGAHELNAADLDIVQVSCDCGNTFDIPWDCTFFMDTMRCGQCDSMGCFSVTADPSPNKKGIE